MDKKMKPANAGVAFPHEVLAYLRKFGWTPSRVVPTSLYEQAYAVAGLPFLPKTKQFLREFGGLIISYTTQSHQEDVLEFLADRAVVGLGGSGTSCFEELIGVAPLFPIGHYLFGTCVLFMDSRGRVFGGSDETVTLIGQTGEQAVGNILSRNECEVLEPK